MMQQQGHAGQLMHAAENATGFDQASSNLSTWKSSLAAAPLPQRHWWGNVVPTGTCPPDTPLKRYGSDGDGGKVLCALEGLQAPCTVLSFGSDGG